MEQGKEDKGKNKRPADDDTVKWVSNPTEGANPRPEPEPATGPEDIPDLTGGSKD
ncbi:MAG: hypothetical protein WBC71_15280 [Salaquimonas sp.]